MNAIWMKSCLSNSAIYSAMAVCESLHSMMIVQVLSNYKKTCTYATVCFKSGFVEFSLSFSHAKDILHQFT